MEPVRFPHHQATSYWRMEPVQSHHHRATSYWRMGPARSPRHQATSYWRMEPVQSHHHRATSYWRMEPVQSHHHRATSYWRMEPVQSHHHRATSYWRMEPAQSHHHRPCCSCSRPSRETNRRIASWGEGLRQAPPIFFYVLPCPARIGVGPHALVLGLVDRHRIGMRAPGAWDRKWSLAKVSSVL